MGWWVRAFLTKFDIVGGPIVMLLYPLYASIKAIESPSKLDDQQWLTYWILYSFVTLVELSFWQLFHWIPLWGKIKFFAVCWLVLPQFNGAAYVYEYFVRKKLFRQGSGDVLVSQRMRLTRSLQRLQTKRANIRHHQQRIGIMAAEVKHLVSGRIKPITSWRTSCCWTAEV
ncbi:hypothetical protein GOP47_0012508 [Adiantum capillus-veneris]|uniref:HVA22-like protein n=1 Tax=Adiantum capillus-veneris TaxID=13818 RepID=A0A9D4URW8_ADICA|nr:hypothetical protein GOP47_0012508 [Adiantum capillus-veneris]